MTYMQYAWDVSQDDIGPHVIERQMWQTLTQRYARQYQISWYAARADVEARRLANGDSEACAWFTRILDGERLTWNDKA